MGKKLTWFRLYGTSAGTLKMIDSSYLGDALKLSLDYFASMGTDSSIEKNIYDIQTKIAFGAIKQGIDDSIQEYNERVADGKKGAEAKKEKMKAQEPSHDVRQPAHDKYNPEGYEDYEDLPFR